MQRKSPNKSLFASLVNWSHSYFSPTKSNQPLNFILTNVKMGLAFSLPDQPFCTRTCTACILTALFSYTFLVTLFVLLPSFPYQHSSSSLYLRLAHILHFNQLSHRFLMLKWLQDHLWQHTTFRTLGKTPSSCLRSEKNNIGKSAQCKTCQGTTKNTTLVLQIPNKKTANQAFHDAYSNIISDSQLQNKVANLEHQSLRAKKLHSRNSFKLWQWLTQHYQRNDRLQI